MAKNLASKLRTGAMIGLAGLALGATAPKANAAVIYDSGLQTVTNTVPAGKLIISYQQTIEDVDTNGDSIFDSYLSKTYVNNKSQNFLKPEDASFWALNMNADLAERGATNMTNYWADWHYEKNGEDVSKMIMNQPGGVAMMPTLDDTFYYTISKDKVLGWENAGASMVANAGNVNLGFQAPIPEPVSAGLLVLGAGALIAGRRVRDRYKY
jgi:hypothetical protein